ncbi:MAG: 1-acyl-sn-glycerol-3-phosphate acyltransferase [Desulfobacterales bacterium]|nr:1-acyl-sn-glycerol-3-phosphate acyltransferase [Desulfobacterales bacterium]MCK7511583.1 1-acyl-sn-glycerol-3-phosphate acyltransferase [Desulfobacterales bacterium]
MILIVYAQDFLDIQDHISYAFSYQREVLIKIKQSPGKGGAGGKLPMVSASKGEGCARMKAGHRGVFYELILFGFFLASKLMRHKAHLLGRENLSHIPTPVIFALTHDSYFEVPSLSRIYYALKPRPDFMVMVKNDFLSGRYLSTNYGKKNKFLRNVLLMIDKSGLPLAIFHKLKVAAIDRPFVDVFSKKKEELQQEISDQLSRFRDSSMQGISTLIFPEGTTWGYGGLKKIRSSVYQVLENTFQSTGRKVYILPINVKVDRLVKGAKDVFIRIGPPVFFRKSKDEFNQTLYELLQQLHIITFSQVAAYYLKRLAEMKRDTARTVIFRKELFLQNLEGILADLNRLTSDRALPGFDPDLLNRRYLSDKVERFLKYCLKRQYLQKKRLSDQKEALLLDIERILSSYTIKEFRKANPLGFCANELTSLGEQTVRSLFDARLCFR